MLVKCKTFWLGNCPYSCLSVDDGVGLVCGGISCWLITTTMQRLSLMSTTIDSTEQYPSIPYRHPSHMIHHTIWCVTDYRYPLMETAAGGATVPFWTPMHHAINRLFGTGSTCVTTALLWNTYRKVVQFGGLNRVFWVLGSLVVSFKMCSTCSTALRPVPTSNAHQKTEEEPIACSRKGCISIDAKWRVWNSNRCI